MGAVFPDRVPSVKARAPNSRLGEDELVAILPLQSILTVLCASSGFSMETDARNGLGGGNREYIGPQRGKQNEKSG